MCTAKYRKPRSVMSVMVGPSLPPCRDEGVPVHHDPVHGIVTNPGNREWGQSPLSFFVVCDNPIHGVLVNWDPPISQVIDLLGPFQKGNTPIGAGGSFFTFFIKGRFHSELGATRTPVLLCTVLVHRARYVQYSTRTSMCIHYTLRVHALKLIPTRKQ